MMYHVSLKKKEEKKEMPFAITVGDYPDYVFMLELKSVNAELFSKILPFMGAYNVIHLYYIQEV